MRRPLLVYCESMDAESLTTDRMKPEPIPIGARVRHIGEQYPEALRNGTGVVVEVMRYYPRDQSYEYLVQCDKPPWGGTESLIERNHIEAV